MGIRSILTGAALSSLLTGPAFAQDADASAEFLNALSNTDGVECYLNEPNGSPSLSLDGNELNVPSSITVSASIDESMNDPENPAHMGYCDVKAENGDIEAVPLINDM